MDAIQLLILSFVLFLSGAIICLFQHGAGRTTRLLAGVTGAVASFVALLAAIMAAVAPPLALDLPVPLPFGHFSLQIDGLSCLMVGMISLLGLAASVYSVVYYEHYTTRNLGVLGFFNNSFIALMLLVVTVGNAFFFLIFWEMMTLVSYFLVTFEYEKTETVQAGYLYMVIAHAGTALIMISFFIFYINTGSFSFDIFRESQLSPLRQSLVFLLAFFGFGAKAGIVPLHIWLPRAHPAAPSPISALLSGVMIKTAIYGFIRVCVDFLGATVLWWGLLVLFFGAITAVLGVFYAMAESDLKRMLAYSSIENVGIILLGIGTGMVGLATNQTTAALLGLLAALYHALNHSFFKGLLFIGAGSVDFRLHTLNLNKMGGLGRLMPWTGAAFLIGALAISAIPPLNGFVSEWFIYQSFFAASLGQDFMIRALVPLLSVVLALVGTLSTMVAVKMYSGVFLGPARSTPAAEAREVPGMMVLVMGFLAGGSLILGIGAPLIAPYLAELVANLTHLPPESVARGIWVFPVNPSRAILSVPLITVLLLAFLAIVFVIVAIYRRYKAGTRLVEDPWACGYRYTPRMSLSASSFDQPIKAVFHPLYQLRTMVEKPYQALTRFARLAELWIVRVEPVVERVVTRPTTRLLETAGQWVQALQMGDIRVYCLYIIGTLAVLLIAIFGRSGL